MRSLLFSAAIALSLVAVTGCSKGEDLPDPPSADDETDGEATGGGTDNTDTDGTDGTDITGEDTDDVTGGDDTSATTDDTDDDGTDDDGTDDGGTDSGTTGEGTDDGGSVDTSPPLPCEGKTTGYGVGDCAVDFTLFDEAGVERSLYDYAGQVIFLDFTAFW